MTGPKPARFGDQPLLAIGLRPFYLLGALFAVCAILRWTLESVGVLVAVQSPAAHAHDMVFGFVGAFIAGFLLTAVSNWTSRPTLTGMGLAGLAAVWICGRLAAVTPYWQLAAVLDLIFWVGLLTAVATPLIATRAIRNFPVCAVVLLLGGLDLLSHLASAGHAGRLDPGSILTAAISVVAVLVALIAGRIIPTFLDRATGAPLAHRSTWIERGTLISTAMVAVADLASIERSTPAGLIGGLAAIAAGFHLVRLMGWRPLRARAQPLLWSLTLGYAWLPVAFSLRVSAALGLTAPSAATHAMTIGVLAGLIGAVATRSSLGHTGRPLMAHTPEAVIYGLIALAASLRISAEFWSVARNGLLLSSGLAFAAAFAVFLVRYAGPLTTPRADGRPG